MSTYRSAGAEVACNPQCRLAVWVLDDDGKVIAYDYVVMWIGPAPLSITPGVATSDPQTFRLVLRGLVPGPYLVAQCVVWPRVSDANWCGVPVTTTVGADRVLDATITATSAFTTRDGTDYTGERFCYFLVATATRTGCLRRVRRLRAPGDLAAGSSTFENHQDIWTGVWGFQSSTATVAAVRAPARCRPLVEPLRHGEPGISTLTSNGSSDIAVHLDAVFSDSDGTVDCHVVACVLAAFDDQDRLVVVVLPTGCRSGTPS